MTGKDKDCNGCAHAMRRFRASKPRIWCLRYKCLRDVRCLDYRSKPRMIQAAIGFFKAMGK